MPRNLSMLCSALLMLTVMTEARALAAPLRVKVISVSTHRPVKSVINSRQDGGAITNLGDTLPNGERTFPNVQCATGLQVQAIPSGPAYEKRPDDWVDCQGDPVVLNARPISSFSAMSQVSFEGIAGAARLGQLLDQARASSSAGDNAKAAVAGNEITARLQQAGANDLADAFGVVTIRSASAALHEKGLLGDVAPVAYDPVQRRDVTTPEARSALKTYQAKTGLETTGKWDFQTLNALAKD